MEYLSSRVEQGCSLAICSIIYHEQREDHEEKT